METTFAKPERPQESANAEGVVELKELELATVAGGCGEVIVG